MFRLFKKEKQNKKEDDYNEQLISDLNTIKLVVGLCRTDREIINKAIKYIETH